MTNALYVILYLVRFVLLANFLFFSFWANSCSGIDEDFSLRFSTNRNTPLIQLENPMSIIASLHLI